MEAIQRQMVTADWMSLIVLLSLLCLVFAKALSYNRFLNFLILPFNNKYLILNNKKGKLHSGFHISMSLFQLMNLSLFGYFAILALVPAASRWDGLFVFWMVLGGLLAFTLVKAGIQLLGGYLFEAQTAVSFLIFQKWSYFNYSSLCLFLANLLLIYLWPQAKALLFAGFILMLVVNIIGAINILKMHQMFVSTRFFYFILYLCALEIAPLLIIYNLVNA
ncbi:DUF4271 domain-containing protein [Robiginitalea sp. M366]|uniref:DUF4271 domain-containing protein n=1 Tax=Robiginitalea aestuariiviva TaxID=3036903 RepID=UPI00240D5AA4|nr:DUF4271 domain-containing protein [Robiginitalea aestuariiviva]MDG1571762.1 DUF4271 domain-containing protein [Robiginitalea aestuariiviva]